MGCDQSTQTVTAGMCEQEKDLAEAEKALGIQKIKAKDFVTAFRKYSFTAPGPEGRHKCTASLQQFRQAAGELKLDIEKVMDPDSNEAKFYRQFQQNSKYNVRELNILGILLGQGTDVEKATLVFEEYDLNCDGNINREECLDVISYLFEVAASYLTTVDPAVSGREDVKPYIAKLKSAESEGSKKLRDQIVGEGYEQVDRAGFIQKLSAANVLNPSSFRTFFHAIGEANTSSTAN